MALAPKVDTHRNRNRVDARTGRNRAIACAVSRNVNDPERNRQIDLGLAVLCALQRPGEVVSSLTIAECTGMSHAGAYAIEQGALKKIRRLAPSFLRSLGHHLA